MKNWKLLSSKRVFSGFRKIDERHYRLPDSSEKSFEIKIEAETVSIFALTSKNKVVIAREFRPGIGNYLNELPGGMIDDGEDPIDAGKRELLEETGYTGDFYYLGSSYLDAYSTGKRHYLLATNAQQQKAATPESTEFIEVKEMPLDELLPEVEKGDLTDCETVYRALFYWVKNFPNGPWHELLYSNKK